MGWWWGVGGGEVGGWGGSGGRGVEGVVGGLVGGCRLRWGRV